MWTGTFLDYTVDFVVKTAKLMYIKCIFALEDVLPPPPQRSSLFDSMMADRRRRHMLYWPSQYLESGHKEFRWYYTSHKYLWILSQIQR